MVITTTPNIEDKRIREYLGVDIDYKVLGEENGMLMVSVSGTAVSVS